MKKKLITILIALVSLYLLYAIAILTYGYFRPVEYHESPAKKPEVVWTSVKIEKENPQIDEAETQSSKEKQKAELMGSIERIKEVEESLKGREVHLKPIE